MRAETTRDAACADGHIVRADLFVAVCAVLRWRDRVTVRWRTPGVVAGNRAPACVGEPAPAA